MVTKMTLYRRVQLAIEMAMDRKPLVVEIVTTIMMFADGDLSYQTATYST